MMRIGWITAALAVIAVSTPVFAGEGKCTANTQECLDYMATKMKDSGWVGVELDRQDEGGPWEVLKVVPASPAEQSGMQAGDFLVAMNGIEFTKDNEEALSKARAEWLPGQSVSYTVRREIQKHELTLTLAAMPADVLARYIGQHMMEHASTAMAGEKAEAAPGS